MMVRRSTVVILATLVAILALGCSEGRDDHGPLVIPESADADAGQRIIESYGCGTCHRIPDIPGANGRVGPSLDGFGRQLYIAGAVPNDYENLVAWLMNPDTIEPGTIMPNFGMGEETAANIAAYLATLR